MCIFALQRIASLILFFSPLPSSHAASDKTVSKDLIVELPTLISLGFGWHIDGDDNRNAGISVQYRKRGEQSWKAGMPLLRLQREQTNSGAFHYTAPNMFAGSSFDLDAGTRLPNINDNFTGRAPNLGAYETGSPVPHYGPRP